MGADAVGSRESGASLPTQTLICMVGDPDKMKALLVVEQSNIQFLQPDQSASLMFDEYRGRRVAGKVRSVSRIQMQAMPRELSTSFGGPLGASPGPSGDEIPQLTYFEASVPLENLGEIRLEPGFRGVAKIRVGTASIGWRIQRFFRTIANFR